MPYVVVKSMYLFSLFCFISQTRLLLVYLCIMWLFTHSIARSATHQYLTYSEADFQVFRPAGVTRCTDGGEIWHGGGVPKVPSSVPDFTPIGATIRV